jgi:hypothetical protein
MKKIVLSISLILLIVSKSYATDLTGDYQCMISAPNSSKQFPGDLSIQKTEKTYAFKWQFSKKVNFQGFGLMDEDLKSIAVLSSQVEKPDNVSLTVFSISPEGVLKGRYMAKDSQDVGIEVCKKKKPN